jgi:hypothetical protein
MKITITKEYIDKYRDKLHQPIDYKDLEIKELTDYKTGTPRYVYYTHRYGHVNYLMHQCKEKGIKAESLNHQVHIFSKNKLPLFIDVIIESLIYDSIPIPSLKEDHADRVYRKGKKVLCVLTKNDVAYVSKDCFPEWMVEVYKRTVPRLKRYFFFSDKKSLMDHLEMEEKILI